jgi:uncharacterized protein (DUF1015 family)
MTLIRPFRALRYDPARVELGRVLVPPYDVISAADRRRLYERDPHSAIRLELTKELGEEAGTDYAQVRERLAQWRAEGVLRLDPRPAFYALRQRFRAPDGSSAQRLGFFGCLRLEDYARGVVRPHERTLAGPKADRLKILRATRANLSSVFLLYEDRADALPALLEPAFARGVAADAEDEAGTRHTLALVQGEAGQRALAGLLAERALVIADGHHRYETALAYRDERRRAEPAAGPDAPFEFLLAYFANAFAPGTLLLPIHRLVCRGRAPREEEWSARLAGWACKQVALAGPEEVSARLAEHLAPLRGMVAFAADDASGVLRIFSRPRAPRELAPRALQREVIEGVFGLDEQAVLAGALAYPKDAVQTARDVREGLGCVALYLNPLDPDDVFRVTAAGELLPQKSTFFTPKLPTGLVFRLLEPAAVPPAASRRRAKSEEGA